MVTSSGHGQGGLLTIYRIWAGPKFHFEHQGDTVIVSLFFIFYFLLFLY